MTPLSIVLILASALLHSSWNFFTKKGNQPVGFFFWVFFCGLILYVPFFIGFGVFPSVLHPPLSLWKVMVTSGFFETIYFICLVKAYQSGDLSFVYPISRSAPLFTQIWAFLFISEIPSRQGLLGIVFVMIGLFVVSLRDFRLQFRPRTSHPITSRPSLLALAAALSSSFYSVFDKVGVQIIHPIFYLWWINVWMCAFTGIFLWLRGEGPLLKDWRESKRDVFLIALLQNAAYTLVLMAMQASKVSYVVAFRQVGALFGAGMGIVLLKESQWKTRITGALILTLGLILLGFAK